VTFTEMFFGPGNGIAWASLQAAGSAQRKALESFLPLVENGAELALLPRLVEEAGGSQQVRWYLLCRTDAARRRAQELVGAFLGPSYLHGSGPPNELDPADPTDEIVARCIGPRSYWVAVPKSLPKELAAGTNPTEPIRSRLQLLARLLDEKPVRTVRAHRPVGRILRDFEYAATARDATTASACLGELEAAGCLTAANTQFLRVRLDAMRGELKRLTDPARVEELLALRPPRQIVQILIEALYESYLRAFDEPARAAELLAAFKGLDRSHRALLRSHRGVSGHAVDMCFLLDAVAYSDRPALAADEVLARVHSAAPGRPVLEAIAKLAPLSPAEPGAVAVTSEATAMQRAAMAFTLGALDDAFVLALGAAEAMERTALLLQIAAEARTIETLAAARDALASTTPDQLARLKRLRRTGDAIQFIEELERPANAQAAVQKGGPLPTSWTEWLERIESPETWIYAVKAAQELGSQWDVAAALVSPEAMDAFVQRLEATRADWGQAAFRDAAPLLVRELARLQRGPELRRVHQALILALGTDPDGSVPQWSAMADIVEKQLTYGLTAAEYKSNLDLLGGQLLALHAFGLVMPALGFLEALCDRPCPAREARLQFVVQLQGLIAQCHGKITRANQQIFAALATFAGLPVDAPRADDHAASAESAMPWFAGKTVALYSLNAAALQRAKSALEAEEPKIVVRCSSDEKGGGPALRELARSADLFIICTAAATHSATTYIEQERGTRPRRRVHRTGATALVDEVRNYAMEVVA
jgi:hypothetical protein